MFSGDKSACSAPISRTREEQGSFSATELGSDTFTQSESVIVGIQSCLCAGAL